MLVRLSLDETHGVGRLRHDVVRGGGVAWRTCVHTIRPQLSLSLGLTLGPWTLVCTTLVLLWTLDDMMT